MSRPEFPEFASSMEGWDADLNDAFGILDGPWPIGHPSGLSNLAALEALYPAAEFDQCLVIAQIGGVWDLYLSDGSAWSRANGLNHGGAIYLSADQAITTATASRINLDTAESDPDSLYSSSDKGIKIKIAGAYLVVAEVACVAGAGSYREAHLYKNGSSIKKQLLPPDATNSQTFSFSKRMVLAVDDVLQLYFKHDKGSDLNVLGDGTAPNLRCTLAVQKVDKAG